MPKVIGIDFYVLRSIVKERGLEDQILSRFSPVEKETYLQLASTRWYLLEQVEKIPEIAAQVLFPDDPDRMASLYYDVAKKTHAKFYKYFLSFPIFEIIVKWAQKAWGSYFDKGQASVENITPQGCDFVLRDFPQLPKVFREGTKGHLLFILGLIGKKNSRIRLEESDPACWRWQIQWD